jgi:undecaprenyl-phosphate 4-deoxy-4-formamido-L-arabinose transferase
MSKTPLLSVVIPAFNEEANLKELIGRCLTTCSSMGKTFEIILVDDGSSDRSAQLITEAAEQNPGKVIGVLLNRNYGQHAAVLAGFAESRGEFVVTLDADLQNPPEEIPKLVEAFNKGHDLVGTIRMSRRDTFFRRWASKFTNKLVKKISGIVLNDFGCMLRGYSREVVKAILSNPEYRTFIPALATLFARNPIEIPVLHKERCAGESKYSLLKLFSLQLDLVTGFSLLPLRVLFFVGTGIAILGLLLGVLILFLRFYYGAQWAGQGVFTLFAVLFFFIGAQLFALGLLGEYIGRIFQAVRKRPPYLLREIRRGQ